MIAGADIPRLLRERRESLTATITRLRGRSARSGARATAGSTPASAPLVGPSELQQHRDRLARRLAELQWDLGGLAYEMAIRDHFRVDVLVRVAAQLQPVDVELEEIERLLRLDEAGAAGACPACGALHARGAAYCWRCGGGLLTASGTASTEAGPHAAAAPPPPAAGTTPSSGNTGAGAP